MAIQHILLKNFRNYVYQEFKISKNFVLVYGCNGSGKTNLLESISLLETPNGMRKVSLDRMINDSYDGQWTVFFELKTGDKIGIAFNGKKKLIKINGRININNLQDFVKVFWVCPQNDRLFTDIPEKRRKFFDNVLGEIFPKYKDLKIRYDHNLLERSKILKEKSFDENWCSIVEDKLVVLGLNIIKLRLEALEYLNKLLKKLQYLPSYTFQIAGEIENLFEEQCNDDIFLDEYKRQLKLNREKDVFLGGCYVGPHKSDYIGFLDNRLLKNCSNGEQCLSIICIFLSLMYYFENAEFSKIILIDEVLTHLDFHNRMLLFKELSLIKTLQTWVSVCDKLALEGFFNDFDQIYLA